MFADFVVQYGIQAAKVQEFEVRYSDVSDWFFPQMRIDEDLIPSLHMAQRLESTLQATRAHRRGRHH